MKAAASFLALVLACSSAHAFNPYEHKLVGDHGSNGLELRITSLDGRVLAAPYDADRNPEVWRITRSQVQSFKDDAEYKSRRTRIYVPTVEEDTRNYEAPLVVWVGDPGTDGHGEWFSFGDLVAIYGDFRRVVTCDVGSSTGCLLTDAVEDSSGAEQDWQMKSKLLSILRDVAMGEMIPYSIKNTYISTDARGTKPEMGNDHMMRLARMNDWHFGERAVRWYVGMHRQALYLLAQAVKTNDDSFFWKALHYDANGLHSLTDLFAPGHIVTDRTVTVEYIMEGVTTPDQMWAGRVFELSGNDAGAEYPFAALVAPTEDKAPSGPEGVITSSELERRWHNGFNMGGARLKNFLGREWDSFGDGHLSLRKPCNNAMEHNNDTGELVNPDEREIVAGAVNASLQALIDARAAIESAVESGADPMEAAREYGERPEFYAALGHIPIWVKMVCWQKKKFNAYAPNKCFSPEEYSAAPYLDYVYSLLGAVRPDAGSTRRVKVVSGPTTTGTGKPNAGFDGRAVHNKTTVRMSLCAED